MSLADLKEVVRDNEDILDELGFPSKTQCKQAFDTVEEYRNKVMHGNRSVISTEEDVENLVESLEIACDLAVNAGGDGPGLDIPP
jgi:predicted polyphosphate/ATP-dependent NAD kinase